MSKKRVMQELKKYDAVIETIQGIFPTCGVALVGGAIRDTIVGLPIKDVDIVITGVSIPLPPLDVFEFLLNRNKYILEFVTGALPKDSVKQVFISGFLPNLTLETLEQYLEDGDDFNTRLHGVVKATIKGVDVDLLIHTSATVLAAVLTFDTVYNLHGYTPDKLWYAEPLDTSIQRIKGDNIFLKKVKPKREAKMIKYHILNKCTFRDYLKTHGEVLNIEGEQ